MTDRRPSEEILNAFVDGEFSPEDRLLTLKSIAGDEQLSHEVCDLYQLKELVGMAYRHDVVPPSLRGPVRAEGGRSGWWKGIAAGVVAVALVAVAALEMSTEQRVGWQDIADTTPTDAGPLMTPDGVKDARQVLLHVTDVDAAEAKILLDDIEFMFETAWLHGQELQVQMVVHGTAMDLVRADLSPFPNRIRDLVHTYSGLTVTACGQSRARHERAEGRTIEFLPWVKEVESGVREAAQKQGEGWTYIRV